eukprot:1184773-Prorocentrum_minimum.AAC.3
MFVCLFSAQELFRPKTGRAPQIRRNAASLPIGDFLYSMRHEFDDKKEFMAERIAAQLAEETQASKEQIGRLVLPTSSKERSLQGFINTRNILKCATGGKRNAQQPWGATSIDESL